jgi:hypothetical protein
VTRPRISLEIGARRPLRAPAREIGARGAATVEVAAVMPVMISLVLALVWMLSLAATQARVVDAARETARVAARSDTRETAVEQGRKVAPEGSSIAIEAHGDDVVVHVRAKVRGPHGLFGYLPLPTVEATATTVREDR